MSERVLIAPAGTIRIRPGPAGRLTVFLPYSPTWLAKIKTVADRRWHPEEKYWTVPHTEAAMAHLLAIFAGEPIDVKPSLRKPERSGQDGEAVPWNGSRPIRDGVPAVVLGPRILDRVRQAIRARHYSQRTEQAYVTWITRYIRHHGKRHPRRWASRRSTGSLRT